MDKRLVLSMLSTVCPVDGSVGATGLVNRQRQIANRQ